MATFDPSDQTPDYSRMLPPEQDRLFRDVIWASALAMLRAYGRRYGYCIELRVVKRDALPLQVESTSGVNVSSVLK
jgi:hypothetical protein